MPVNPIQIPAKQSGMSQLGGIVGGVVGGVYGGSAQTAMQGYGAGSAIGGMISPSKQGMTLEVSQDRAISRRLQAQQQDVGQQLENAQQALTELPPEQREKFERPIMEALNRYKQGV